MGQQKTIAMLGYSIILHFIILQLLSVTLNLKSRSNLVSNPAQKFLKMETVSQDYLKKLRRVGVKNGNKSFSAPVFTKPPLKGKKTIQQKESSNLSFKDLGKINNPSPNRKNSVKPVSNPSQKPIANLKLKKGLLPRRASRHSQIIKRNIHQQLSQSPDISNILERKGFNVQFEAPDGISLDELNSIEKAFYSFQKRSYASYLSAFIESYHQFLKTKPAIKKDLKENDHLLTGKITFDHQGHIVAIKIMKSSHSDHVHSLFQKTLESVRKLPNPPKDLLSKEKTLTIYYQLKIN